MNANSVNEKRKADSDPEDGEIVDPLVKKRIEVPNLGQQNDKIVHTISNPSSSSKKNKHKEKKTPEAKVNSGIDPTPAKSNPSQPEDESEEDIEDNEEEKANNTKKSSSKRKKKQKKGKEFQKLDIENYPEQQILLCSYNDCPMLVHISKVDIKLPNHFYSKQRAIRTDDSKNSFEIDPNVLEFKLEPELQKYWEQRYFLFNKYDKGIKLDKESWYSATPESVALYTANRLKGAKVILDAFCGAGGNTIQVSKHFYRLIS
jgi:RNA cap guanine-N2 methyltransferase